MRMVPAGLGSGTAAFLALVWALYLADPDAWPGLIGAVTLSALAAANVAVTALNRRVKVAGVRVMQRRVLNPLVRALHSVGLNPLGVVLLETRGRASGLPRRVPVGNGREGDVLWVVAEHGMRAGWVRNVRADPRVRVRMRVGLRHCWFEGLATVLPADDPLARQRRICRWHPLRMLNAIVVRVLGADLVTVRIDLAPAPVRVPETVDA